MRRSLALVLAVAALSAGTADAAPLGVTFTDPAGDANFLDGAHGAGSQAAFDVTKVRISPYQRTKKTSGLTIRIDIAAVPSTAPGSSYVFVARQGACDITVSRTATTDGIANSTFVVCEPVVGEYHSYSVAKGMRPTGNSIVFTVPADALPDAALGATLTGIEVATATGEPLSGFASPARIDRAGYPKAYRVGS